MPTFYVPACLRAIRRRRRHRWIVAAIHPLCTSPYRDFFSPVLCLCLYTLCYIKLLLFYSCSIARTTTPFDLVSLNLHSQCSHSCCQRAYKHIPSSRELKCFRFHFFCCIVALALTLTSDAFAFFLFLFTIPTSFRLHYVPVGFLRFCFQ